MANPLTAPTSMIIRTTLMQIGRPMLGSCIMAAYCGGKGERASCNCSCCLGLHTTFILYTFGTHCLYTHTCKHTHYTHTHAHTHTRHAHMHAHAHMHPPIHPTHTHISTHLAYVYISTFPLAQCIQMPLQ